MNNLFHFIFGLNEEFNNKPFGFFHYLNLKSCYLTQNQPKIYIHCIFEPKNNIWWEKTKEFVTVINYNTLPDLVYVCNNKKVWRIEHQSDIFRLLILNEFGGVYADVDTLFYKPFFPTFNKQKTILGIESLYCLDIDNIKIHGLCNALIISNKNSEFINIWLDSYKNQYDDYEWNKMSVRKPYEIYKNNPNLIHIESNVTFHKYNWNHLFYKDDQIFECFTSYMSDNGIFSKHMCESKTYELLKEIDFNFFNKNQSLYSKMCKNIKGLIE
jgi:hypothetical protein